jgi:dienelactone hydrolase
MGTMRRAALIAAVVLAASLAGCGNDGSDDGLEVTSEILSDRTAQDVLVVEPVAEGPWPVIVAFHGIDGTARDMQELASRLAGEGYVVFAPTFHTDITTYEGVERGGMDAECGYRFARSIAAEHGGDLDRPVTFVGWSLGASMALAIGLSEFDPSAVPCFGPAPRPDVVVAVSGCHYEGGDLDLVDAAAWANEEAEIVLVAGDRDTECPAWESRKAATEIRSAGYEVDLVTLEGANHYAPVFHDVVGGEFVVIADDPPGDRTVEVILDAIAARQDRR